jgi:hypothetical protein
MPTPKAVRKLWRRARHGEDPETADLAIQRQDGEALVVAAEHAHPEADVVLGFVNRLGGAHTGLERRLDTTVQELFPPILRLVTEMQGKLDQAGTTQATARDLASSTSSPIAAGLARDAILTHQRAENLRRDNLRILLAKAQALLTIRDTVREMMTLQNSPVQAAAAEIADINAAMEMKRAANADLAEALHEEQQVTRELDAAIAARMPELLTVVQKAAATSLDIFDVMGVLMDQRGPTRQLARVSTVDSGFEHLLVVGESEQAILRTAGSMALIEVSAEDVPATAREVAARLKAAIEGEDNPPLLAEPVKSNPEPVEASDLECPSAETLSGLADRMIREPGFALRVFSNESWQTSKGDALDAYLSLLTHYLQKVKAPEDIAFALVAWCNGSARVFGQHSPPRIKLARAISGNKGFSDEDRRSLYRRATSGMDSYIKH